MKHWRFFFFLLRIVVPTTFLIRLKGFQEVNLIIILKLKNNKCSDERYVA